MLSRFPLLIAFAAGVLCPGPSITAAEVLMNASGFSVDIPGCPESSKSIRECSGLDVYIDVLEVQEGGKNDGAHKRPGPARFSHIVLKRGVTRNSPSPGELQQWWQEAAKGKGIRKNITVTLYKSDKSPGRSYVLTDCFPTQWSTGTDLVHREATESIECSVEGITIVSGGAPGDERKLAPAPDPSAPMLGIKVEIGAAGYRESDFQWSACEGGGEIYEFTDKSLGQEYFKTNSPGHKTVGEITLRGAMTDGRKAMCEWINETVNDRPTRRTLDITQIVRGSDPRSEPAAGKSFNFHECWPCRWKAPELSVYKTEGPVLESVTFQATQRTDIPSDAVGQLQFAGLPGLTDGAVAACLQECCFDLDQIATTGDARKTNFAILFRTGSGGKVLDLYNQAATGAVVKIDGQIITGSKRNKVSQTVNLLQCSPGGYSSSRNRIDMAIDEGLWFVHQVK